MPTELKGLECVKLVASTPNGIIDCYDDQLNRFCDDGEPDTINRCFEAGWLEQWYDTSFDEGTVRLTKSGRAMLSAAGERK